MPASYSVSNNTPFVLANKYQEPLAKDFDPIAILDNLFDPVWASTGAPVTITDNNNNNQAVTRDDLINMIVSCCDENYDASMEEAVQDILRQTIRHYSPNDETTVQDIYSVIDAGTCQAPLPSAKPGRTYCQYTATDILDVCKEFIAGATSVEMLRCYFGFYTRTQCLAWYFKNQAEFDKFKTWLDTLVQPMSAFLSADTMNMITDFKMNVQLKGLTESLLLRRDDSDNVEPYSFARILIHALMTYQSNPMEAGIMPLSLGELICPRALVFVNVEKHARATVNQITNEWKIIKQSIISPLKIYDPKRINKLTTAAHAIQKAQTQGDKHGSVVKAARFKIRKTAPQTADVVAFIKKVLKKSRKVLISENPEIIKIKTFNRPNRRHPDDPTKMGTLTNVRFWPDLHIYADTSGSISDQDYAVTMKTMIKLAKALNVNLYYNSWSTGISTCSKIPTKNKSVEEIYRLVVELPKVSGGTDIEPVWRYINASSKRKREISIVTTDFGFGISNRDIKIPPHCYYVPTTNASWNQISREIEYFIKNTYHLDPSIAKKICM